MSDLEQYGDYNDTEEYDERPRGFRPLTLIKWLIFVLIAAVVFLLGARLILFSYYPAEVRRTIPTDALRAYATDKDNIGALTQELRFPYDDCDLDTLNSNDLGTFFAGHLTVVPETGSVQIAVRLNTAAYETMATRLGVDPLTDADLGRLTFRLRDNDGNLYEESPGRVTASVLFYRYLRVAFDGVPLGEPGDGTTAPAWLRLEIGLEGADTPYSYLLIYENNDAYHTFRTITLKKEELLP